MTHSTRAAYRVQREDRAQTCAAASALCTQQQEQRQWQLWQQQAEGYAAASVLCIQQ